MGSFTAPDYVGSHLRESLEAGLAETFGDEKLSRILRAQAKLRLITMSDEQLQELARLTAGVRPVGLVYDGFKKVVKELASRNDWTKDLF